MTARGGPQFIPRPQEWGEGRPAPWSTPHCQPAQDPRHIGSSALDLDRVREIFPPNRRGRRSPVETEGASPSAVLVPFYSVDGRSNRGGTGGTEPDITDLHVLLTRRSWQMRTHRGEVSFPGGRCEPGEPAADAAVREAWEETALDPSSVEVLGELDHLTTVTRRAYIVPVVAVLPGVPEVIANPQEVDEVLLVSVEELLAPGVFREERWGSAEMHRPIYFFDIVGDTIWGATAAMLRQALALLVGADAGSLIDLDPARGVSSAFRLTTEESDGVV